MSNTSQLNDRYVEQWCGMLKFFNTQNKKQGRCSSNTSTRPMGRKIISALPRGKAYKKAMNANPYK